MRHLKFTGGSQRGFSLIEMIITIVVAAVASAMLLSYMGTSLIRSSDSLTIGRYEGLAETWMERITADFVKEMNDPAGYTTALATIRNRDYTQSPYGMPATVTLARTYITYDQSGNEVVVPGGGTSTNLKLTVQAGGYSLNTILASERTSDGDPIAYY